MGRRCATSVDTSSHLTKKLPSNYQDILHAADLGSLALNRRHDVRSVLYSFTVCKGIDSMPFVTKTALLPIIRWVQKYTLEIRLELFRTLFKEASKSGKAGIGRQIERNIRCRLFGETGISKNDSPRLVNDM
ncbi:hypothetical protein T4D_10479 [Trichinella pseudospiralis]|uniref:Uncharacterized protein n=1 Tax=Trichinella pseudospiralis TaxID=6337 RepID=A0A0V1FQQ3_TRIPS|nr:hypothetical protein T4D_10479 [Trichinella pseudospiralis]